MNNRLYCIGDFNGDLVIPYGALKRAAAQFGSGDGGEAPSVSLQPGGSVMNTALALARFGQRPTLISKIGIQSGGQQLLGQITGEGIDTSLVIRKEMGPLLVCVVLDETGERTMSPWLMPGGCSGLFEEGETEQIPADCQWVHTTGIVLRTDGAHEREVLRFVQRCRERGATVSFDLNLRPETFGFDARRRAVFSRMLELSDVIFGSGADELYPLTGCADLRRAALALGKEKTVLVRDGANPVILARNGTLAQFPVHRVRQLHKIGAGDSFNAGYITAVRRGCSAETAVAWGCCSAAYTISHEAPMSIPSPGDIQKMLSEICAEGASI